jgi:hypothetical protein
MINVGKNFRLFSETVLVEWAGYRGWDLQKLETKYTNSESTKLLNHLKTKPWEGEWPQTNKQLSLSPFTGPPRRPFLYSIQEYSS